MKKHSPFKIIIAVLIPLAVGFLSSLLAGSQKFGSFAVPQFTPPGRFSRLYGQSFTFLSELQAILYIISRSFAGTQL